MDAVWNEGDTALMQRASRRALWIVGCALVGAIAGYYLPLIWFLYAYGLTDTSGGPKGPSSVAWLAPVGAVVGAVAGGLIERRRTAGSGDLERLDSTPIRSKHGRRAEAATIYYSGGEVWLLAVAGSMMALVSGGALLTGALVDTGDVGFWVVGAPMLLFICALFSFASRESLQHLLHRSPVLHLDELGLECAYGRVNWGRVEGIELGEGETQRIRFRFLPGTIWISAARRYSTFLLLRGNTEMLEMGYWTSPLGMRQALARYYTGDIKF
jgi:hypothetical protein